MAWWCIYWRRVPNIAVENETVGIHAIVTVRRSSQLGSLPRCSLSSFVSLQEVHLGSWVAVGDHRYGRVLMRVAGAYVVTTGLPLLLTPVPEPKLYVQYE